MSIAWVLGAGFSRSLGGPLLPDLLSRHAFARLLARDEVAGFMTHQGVNEAQQFLNRVMWDDQSKHHGAFGDAEQLLEYLDLATSDRGDGARRRIASVNSRPKMSVKEAELLAAGARRIIAAQCAAFLYDHPPTGERWEPYRTWAQGLQPDDVIVSFNYDMVVEVAATVAGRAIEVFRILPDEKLQGGRPLLFKLHGSVDWRLATDQIPEPTGDAEFVFKCAPEEIAIASPGESKWAFTERWKPMWTRALEAIKNADAVVFIGYRFPESDANSRAKLTQAITAMGKTLVAVHVVLGQDTGGSASLRVKRMLEYCLLKANRERDQRNGAPGPGGTGASGKGYVLQVQPFFAQDFLALVQRWDIEHPARLALPT